LRVKLSTEFIFQVQIRLQCNFLPTVASSGSSSCGGSLLCWIWQRVMQTAV